MDKILTVPSVEKISEKYFLTGNHYVSLPDISPNASIKNIAFLSGELRALTEFVGELTPKISVNGKARTFDNGVYENDFIPAFTSNSEDADLKIKYVAPEKLHGFICSFSVTAKTDCKVSLGFALNFDTVRRAIFHPYKLEGKINVLKYSWTNTLIYELINGKSYGGFGISCSLPNEISVSGVKSKITCDVTLKAKEKKEVLFYVSVAAETDGIGLVNMDMRRRGAQSVTSQEELLKSRHTVISNKILEKYANFNANFCYYYSSGYTLDTEELCLITSKSSKYYVSSAFWGRDSYLWAFPAILHQNPEFAKEVLLLGFTKYLKNVGIHANYLDGKVLYPGFELDELVSPVIAYQYYKAITADEEIERDPRIVSGLEYIKNELSKYKDEKFDLYYTELDSSDDPVDLKYNVYDNALTARALKTLGEKTLSDSVKEQIYLRCVKFYKGKKIFAYSMFDRSLRVYDNPPGSLALLRYYGFCDRSDETYQNTLDFAYSPKNPYFYEKGDLLGLGCEHTPYPWSVSLINYLVGTGDMDERFIKALEIVAEKYPIVTESFNLETGDANTGDAFATMAGFIANGIYAIYGK